MGQVALGDRPSVGDRPPHARRDRLGLGDRDGRAAEAVGAGRRGRGGHDNASSRSIGRSCAVGRVGLLGQVSGEREEHVVERCAAEPDVVGLDPASSSARTARATGTLAAVERRRRAAVRPDRGVARGRWRPRARSAAAAMSTRDQQDDLDGGTADRLLQLVGRSVRDDGAVVDDQDVVGEPVGLLEVLRGEQHGDPVRDEVAQHVPQVVAAARVEARSSARRGRAPAARRPGWRRGRVGDACRPSRSWPAGRPASVSENRSRSSSTRALRPGPAEVVEAADQLEVAAAGQQLVDRRLLAGEADAGPHAGRLAHDVEPGDLGRALVGGQQRGEDADGRGLARAVGAEQAADGAGRARRGRGRAAPSGRRSACPTSGR